MPQNRLLSYRAGIFCPSANPDREMNAYMQLDQTKQMYSRSRALKAQKSLSPLGHWSVINNLAEDLEACSVTTHSTAKFQPVHAEVLKTKRETAVYEYILASTQAMHVLKTFPENQILVL